jgi:hypothetical protein
MPGLNLVRGDEILDMMQSSGYNSPAGMRDLQGGSRLMSGMSIEGFMADTGGHGALTMSRNTSGLDTMQSIEQALPDNDQCGREHPPPNS